MNIRQLSTFAIDLATVQVGASWLYCSDQLREKPVPWPCCFVESLFKAYTPPSAPKPIRTILHTVQA